MFKIGDFSRIGQVSVRMLRHYDQLGLLKPEHTDPFSSYRYYTIEQLPRLHRIVALNDLGLTLQQVSTLLDPDDGELSVEQLRGMLTVRQAEIERELSEKQVQLIGVAARLEQIAHEGRPSPYEIVIKAAEPLALVGVRMVVPHVAQMDHYCAAMYGQLYAAIAQYDIVPVGPEVTIYHADEYTDTDLDVEAAVPIDPQVLARAPHDARLVFHHEPAVAQVASLAYTCTYAGVVPGVLALLAWVGRHGRQPQRQLREWHLSGPAHIAGRLQEPAILELQVPLRA